MLLGCFLRDVNINETMKTYTHLFNDDYVNNLNKVELYIKNYSKQDQKQDQKTFIH